MTIQEEIVGGLCQLFDESGVYAGAPLARDILLYLRSKGAVIKVDKELPPLQFEAPNNSFEHNGQMTMLQAGYVAVEPLIKE